MLRNAYELRNRTIRSSRWFAGCFGACFRLPFSLRPALPARAAEAYQVSTISSLLAGGYDGTTTIGEMLQPWQLRLRHLQRRGRGDDGARWPGLPRYRRRPGPSGRPVRAHPVRGGGCRSSRNPRWRSPRDSRWSSSRRRSMRSRTAPRASWRRGWTAGSRRIRIRSEPKQTPPYRPLAEVIKTQQVVHTLNDVQGTLIGFRFPAAASSVNVAGWHFHFLSADKTRGGHVLALTTGDGLALVRGDLRPAHQLPRQRSRIHRQRRIDQGGGTSGGEAGE